MSADRDIDALLAELEFGNPGDAGPRTGRAAGRSHAAGKKRISDEELPRVRKALVSRFFVHCSSPA